MVHPLIYDIEPVVSYTVGANPRTIFPVPYLFFANSDLIVTVSGVVKVLNTDYTVSGALIAGGGGVRFVTAITNAVVLIVRELPLERVVDFPLSGPFDIDGLNTQLDKIIALIQQINTDNPWTPPDQVNNTAISISSHAVASTITVDSNVVSVRTSGYNDPGDGGGALYKRVSAQPTHSGWLQTANSIYFEIAEVAVNVLQFGARASGNNDTNALQAAIHYVTSSTDLGAARKLRVPGPATYLYTNLIVDGILEIEGDGPHVTVLKVMNGGDGRYGLAQTEFTSNAGFTAPPMILRNLTLDGGSLVDNVLVVYGYDCLVENCFIFGCKPGTGANLLITGAGIDGVTTGGGGSGNIIRNNYIGYATDTALYQINVVDPLLKMADLMLIDNTLQTAVVGLNIPQASGWAAGWTISRNHFFLCSTYDFVVHRTGLSTNFSENYVEGRAKIIAGNSAGKNNKFSNNTINGQLDVAFAPDAPGDVMLFHSSENTFGSGAFIKSLATHSQERIFSRGDTFDVALPYQWNGGAANVGWIVAQESYNASTGRRMNGASQGSLDNNAFLKGVYVDDARAIGIDASVTSVYRPDGATSFLSADSTTSAIDGDTITGRTANKVTTLFSATAAGFTARGTNTNDSAAALFVGEFAESEILIGSAVSATSGAALNVTSISLTAGDWNVWGNVATSPAGGTTTSQFYGAINTTSATLPTAPGKGAYASIAASVAAGVGVLLPVGTRRLSLNATTTVYMVANATFAVSTMGIYGYIGARRMR